MIHLHGTQAVAFRVLIVDDEPARNDILARCVEMLGWTADTAAGLEVRNLLLALPEPGLRSVVVVTHDPAVASDADRVVRIRDGRIETEETMRGIHAGALSHA